MPNKTTLTKKSVCEKHENTQKKNADGMLYTCTWAKGNLQICPAGVLSGKPPFFSLSLSSSLYALCLVYQCFVVSLFANKKLILEIIFPLCAYCLFSSYHPVTPIYIGLTTIVRDSISVFPFNLLFDSNRSGYFPCYCCCCCCCYSCSMFRLVQSSLAYTMSHNGLSGCVFCKPLVLSNEYCIQSNNSSYRFHCLHREPTSMKSNGLIQPEQIEEKHRFIAHTMPTLGTWADEYLTDK